MSQWEVKLRKANCLKRDRFQYCICLVEGDRSLFWTIHRAKWSKANSYIGYIYSIGLLLISIENYCKGCLFAIHVNRLNHYFPLIFLFLIFVFLNGLPSDMKIFRIGNFLYVLGKFFVSTFCLWKGIFFGNQWHYGIFPKFEARWTRGHTVPHKRELRR